MKQFLDSIDIQKFESYEQYLSENAIYEISKTKKNIPERFIEKYIEIVHIDSIFKNGKYSELFIEKYWYKISNEIIFQYQDLSINFLNKYLDDFTNSDWKIISRYQKLTCDFMRLHFDFLDKDLISRYQYLDCDFINDFKDRLNIVIVLLYQKNSNFTGDKIASALEKVVDSNNFDNILWDNISSTSGLSEPFMEKYSDKLNWDFISKFQKLSGSFIEKHIDKLNWELISQFQKLSEPFIEKHIYNFDIHLIITYQTLSENLLMKFYTQDNSLVLPIIFYNSLSFSFVRQFSSHFEYLNTWLTGDVECWNTISYIDLTDKNIESFCDKLNFNEMLRHGLLKSHLFEKYIDYYDTKILSKYNNIDQEFIERNHKKFYDEECWENLAANSKLSTKFIKEFLMFFSDKAWENIFKYQNLQNPHQFVIDGNEWGLIFRYQKLSNEYIEKYFDKIPNLNEMIIYQELSEEFIKNNHQRLEMTHVIAFQKMSEEFARSSLLRKYYNEFNCNFSMIDKEKYGDLIQWDTISSIDFDDQQFCENINWYIQLKYNQHFYLERCKLDWYRICKEIKLTFRFMELHKHFICFDTCLKYQNLSKEFIEKYFFMFDRFEVSYRGVFTEDFIRKHEEDLDMDIILLRQTLSKEFVKSMSKHFDYFNSQNLYNRFPKDCINFNTIRHIDLDQEWYDRFPEQLNDFVEI